MDGIQQRDRIYIEMLVNCMNTGQYNEFSVVKEILNVTEGIATMALHSVTLNELISHLSGPMANKSLEILQEVEHREEPSFSNQFIHHNTRYKFFIWRVTH